jgi:hypothetical protein
VVKGSKDENEERTVATVFAQRGTEFTGDMATAGNGRDEALVKGRQERERGGGGCCAGMMMMMMMRTESN